VASLAAVGVASLAATVGAASLATTPASASTRHPLGFQVQLKAGVVQPLGSGAHVPVPSALSHHPHPVIGVQVEHEV
jgi:hypothetical protein